MTRTLRTQPEAYRRYRDAYQRGAFAEVVRTGDALAEALDRESRNQAFVPAVAMMRGAALAELDSYVEACRFLELGLDRLSEDEDSNLRELSDGDWFALRLVELLTKLGRYGDAWGRLTALEEPTKPHTTRLAALRGRAALNTIRGDYEGAHHLLNAATSVVDRINSQFLVAEIEADRVVVLAVQGRMLEATMLADRVLERLGRPAAGRRGSWSSESTAAVALTLSRLCVEAGNLKDGERYLLVGSGAVERAPTTYLSAHVDLAISTLWCEQGSAGGAEPLCRDAERAFSRLACRPSEAQATLELALIARARGMATSALPLLERAHAEFSYLGHARELSVTEALLRRADREAERLTAEVNDPVVDDSAFRPGPHGEPDE